MEDFLSILLRVLKVQLNLMELQTLLLLIRRLEEICCLQEKMLRSYSKRNTKKFQGLQMNKIPTPRNIEQL